MGDTSKGIPSSIQALASLAFPGSSSSSGGLTPATSAPTGGTGQNTAFIDSLATVLGNPRPSAAPVPPAPAPSLGGGGMPMQQAPAMMMPQPDLPRMSTPPVLPPAYQPSKPDRGIGNGISPSPNFFTAGGEKK